MPNKQIVLILAIVAVQFIGPTFCKSSAEELTAIKQLRKRIGVDNLYQDYMKTDQYLLTFLKARRMNVNSAAEMLQNSLKWRKENDIDSLVNDTDCHRDYPFRSAIIDKLGRPVLEMNVKEWDIRKQMLAGKADRFVRCSLKAVEVMNAKVRQQNAEFGGDEKNITQWAFIVNLQGYSLRQHGCVPCFPAMVNALLGYEANYPGSIHTFYLLNAPSIFETLLTIAKSVLSQESSDSLRVYGFESTEWKKALLDIIPKDQLSPVYGGTKTH